jgi:hypothetical protein
MFIALNSWFWPVRGCLKCLPSDWAKGPLCVLAGVTYTLVVDYTTLQRVTPTRLHCQIQSCRHLHASVAQLKLDSENVFIWTHNARLHSPVCVNRVMWFCGAFLAMRQPETKQSTGVKFCHGGMLLT